jgi:hypothetical protein
MALRQCDAIETRIHEATEPNGLQSVRDRHGDQSGTVHERAIAKMPDAGSA